MLKINIAIDGHAGCGKSTTAKQVAHQLGYLFIDSGAMYRAVSLFFLREGIPFDNVNPAMIEGLNRLQLSFVQKEGASHPEICLNGEAVESEIRKPEISEIVSQVSAIPLVRHAMVRQQQEIGKDKGVVMDGRDIGTVVFPDAELKIFMTASVEVRAKRRKAELEKKGISISLESIVENLRKRDKLDSSRAEGPLKQASDSIVIDTTEMTVEAQVDQVVKLAKLTISEYHRIS